MHYSILEFFQMERLVIGVGLSVLIKELDRVFCFGSKILIMGHRKDQLANEGSNDWTNLGNRLKERETSVDHVLNMTTWYELRSRFQTAMAVQPAKGHSWTSCATWA